MKAHECSKTGVLMGLLYYNHAINKYSIAKAGDFLCLIPSG